MLRHIWWAAIFLLASRMPSPTMAVICVKDHQSPLGIHTHYIMNVDCGRYVEHCLKIVTYSGHIYRDCDTVTLCPKDGSKYVNAADYFCCRHDLCNSAPRPHGALLPLIALTALLLVVLFM